MSAAERRAQGRVETHARCLPPPPPPQCSASPGQETSESELPRPPRLQPLVPRPPHPSPLLPASFGGAPQERGTRSRLPLPGESCDAPPQERRGGVAVGVGAREKMATPGSEPQPFVPALSVSTLPPHHHAHHHHQHHGGTGANGGVGGGGGGSSGGFNLPLNRGLERALEEAANSGGLNLSARKLKEFPRTTAPGHDLSDTVQAGERGRGGRQWV